MNKYLKYSLISIAAIVAVMGSLLAYVAATVNPNDYKPQIVKLVKEKQDRTLVLQGDIKLQLFPRLGLDLGKASLSEHGSNNEFARIDRLQLYLAWLPLLHKSLEVDKVSISGVEANLLRFADGKTNFDDFLQQKSGGDNGKISFDIQSVEISQCALSFDDQINKRRILIKNLALKTGRLKEGVHSNADLLLDLALDNPLVRTHIALHTGFLYAEKHFALDAIDMAVIGDAAGLSNVDFKLQGAVEYNNGDLLAHALSLSLTANQNGNSVNVKFDAPKLALTKETVSSEKISLLANLTQEKSAIKIALSVPAMAGNSKAFHASGLTIDIDGKMAASALQGKIAGDLAGSLENQSIELQKLTAKLDVANPSFPGGKGVFSSSGNVRADMQTIAADLVSRLDDSNIVAQLQLHDFSAPQYRFDVKIDQIDADRYLKSEAKTTVKPEAAKAEADATIDLSALKSLNAQGSLKVGTLKIRNIKSTDVRLDMHAAGGRLDLNPIAANLYQGNLAGSLSANALGNTFMLKQNLKGISIGPLLRDATGKDMLEGRGSVTIDVTTNGDKLGILKKKLNGNAALNLVDGAIKGINIAATLRNLQAKMGTASGQQSQAVNSAEKTDFAELKGSFRIHDGVAHNDDLSMKSPLLRLGGSGDIDIGQSSMDYLAKVTVVGTLQGQGGAELASLKGITIPIRLSGPFDSLKYSIDMGALVKGAVQGKVEQKKEEVKQKLQDQLKGGLKGLFK